MLRLMAYQLVRTLGSCSLRPAAFGYLELRYNSIEGITTDPLDSPTPTPPI